jgi:hypothetical protein
MLTQERANQLFEYTETTGDLRFKPRPESEFATHRAFKIFQSKCEGKIAGWKHCAGYVSLRVDGKDWLAHRLIWLMATGEIPDGEIDHKNGDRSDNRLSNLRVVTKTENARNQSLRLNNSTGVNGVIWDTRRSAFRAEITLDGRLVYLGQFKTVEEAGAARQGAEKVAGFSRGHGKRPKENYYRPRKSKALHAPNGFKPVDNEPSNAAHDG